MDPAVRAQAETWLASDPDPGTRAQLRAMLDADDWPALTAAFGPAPAFGTAGIRAPLGPGPARMNRLVVRRVTMGLAARLTAEADPAGRVVVVGRDARHGSAAFAEETASVLAGAGFDVQVFAEPVPTPLLAFAVRHLAAAAGVQITASHNPPQDNGYKVYWAGGAQIAPPLDAEIAAAIAAVPDVAPAPVATDPPEPVDVVAVTQAYLTAALAHVRYPTDRNLAIVATPLHGVAGELLVTLLHRGGFADVTLVAEQALPDPDFPTVGFPNPEEPGALDRAIALAAQRRADLVLANDPDGDRIAVAVPDGDPGEVAAWRMLSGDETGCVLAEHLLSSEIGLSSQSDAERVVATTVVSSQLLARIAGHHRAGYVETLTGFKWLAQVAQQARAEGRRFVLAYEQALGVMVGDAVLDKDGLSAALVVADLAAHLKSEGACLLDVLDDLARRHGVHATSGWSVRLEGPQAEILVGEVLTRLRDDAPASIGGIDVVAVADHAVGVRRRSDGSLEALGTPRADLVGLILADGSRLQVRPSGTEPLLKFYAEVVEPAGDDLAEARRRAAERLPALVAAFTAAVGL